MLQKLRAARLIWPTILAIAGVAILASLGNWQMRRKAWKEGLIAQIEQGARSEPIGLTQVLASGDPAAFQFRRVRVTGRLLNEREFHVWMPGPQGPAWSIVTPLELGTPIGPGARYPTRLVLIIRGVVPEAHKDASSRPAGQVTGEVAIIGRVRLGGSGWFTGEPDLARNQWLSFDLTHMRRLLAADAVEGSASGSVDEALSLVAPVLVEAEATVGGEGAPVPRLDALRLSNRHLEYALTWYGLALTLIGVYFAFAASRLRVLATDA